jgi:hypothetical protein
VLAGDRDRPWIARLNFGKEWQSSSAVCSCSPVLEDLMPYLCSFQLWRENPVVNTAIATNIVGGLQSLDRSQNALSKGI